MQARPSEVAVTSPLNSASAPEKQENAFAKGPALPGTFRIHIFIHCLWRTDYLGPKSGCSGDSDGGQPDPNYANDTKHLS